MRMLRIVATKRREKLTSLELQIGRQRSRLQIRFLQFDVRLIIFVQLQNDIGETFEIRINRSIEGDFRVAQ